MRREKVLRRQSGPPPLAYKELMRAYLDWADCQHREVEPPLEGLDHPPTELGYGRG